MVKKLKLFKLLEIIIGLMCVFVSLVWLKDKVIIKLVSIYCLFYSYIFYIYLKNSFIL